MTVQETHSRRKGRIMIENMVVFEVIRNKKGGGTICAIHQDLNPKMIVVEVDGNKRIITGYGPQENLNEDKRLPFFITLEEEIVKGAVAGKAVIIEMDANAKLGPKYIPGDPHEITPNGKLLAGIVERQHLVVVNGSNMCKGKITSRRVSRKKVEESIINMVIVSSVLATYIDSLEIDESRNHVLTRIRKTKKGTIKKESDHNVLITTFKNTFKISEKKEKIEMFNLKNIVCQRAFKEYTSNIKMLSSVLNSEETIDVITERLIKKINGCLVMTYKKVRITQKKKSKVEILHSKMNKLKEENNQEELEKVIEEVAYHEEERYTDILKELSKTKDQTKHDSQRFWKIKNKDMSKFAPKLQLR